MEARALAQLVQKRGWHWKEVGWEDVARNGGAGVPQGLSAWGANISDVRLASQRGRVFGVIRHANFTDHVRISSGSDISVVANDGSLVSLTQWLQESPQLAAYTGITSSLANLDLDDRVSVRYQCAFLPPYDDDPSNNCHAPAREHAHQPLNFCTTVYNYQTQTRDAPRNLLLLCTAQGSFLQQDQPGANRLFVHNAATKEAHWLEAEATRFKVGEEQLETKEEVEVLEKRGKAVAKHFGTVEMRGRMNVQMVVQVPVVQPLPPAPRRCNCPHHHHHHYQPQPLYQLLQHSTKKKTKNTAATKPKAQQQHVTAKSSAANLVPFKPSGSQPLYFYQWHHTRFASWREIVYYAPNGLPAGREPVLPVTASTWQDHSASLKKGAASTWQYPAGSLTKAAAVAEEEEEEEEELAGGGGWSFSGGADDEDEGGDGGGCGGGWGAGGGGGSEAAEEDDSGHVVEEEEEQQLRRQELSEVPRTACAARVSLGQRVQYMPSVKLCRSSFTRDPKQHLTVTVTMYYMVDGRTPSEAEVNAAIADLESLYAGQGVSRQHFLGTSE